LESASGGAVTGRDTKFRNIEDSRVLMGELEGEVKAGGGFSLDKGAKIRGRITERRDSPLWGR